MSRASHIGAHIQKMTARTFILGVKNPKLKKLLSESHERELKVGRRQARAAALPAGRLKEGLQEIKFKEEAGNWGMGDSYHRELELDFAPGAPWSPHS